MFTAIIFPTILPLQAFIFFLHTSIVLGTFRLFRFLVHCASVPTTTQYGLRIVCHVFLRFFFFSIVRGGLGRLARCVGAKRFSVRSNQYSCQISRQQRATIWMFMYFLLILRAARRSTTCAQGFYQVWKRVLFLYRLSKCQCGVNRVKSTTRFPPASSSATGRLYLVTRAGLPRFSANTRRQDRVLSRLARVGSSIYHGMRRGLVIIGYVFHYSRFRVRPILYGFFLTSRMNFHFFFFVFFCGFFIVIYHGASRQFRELSGLVIVRLFK